MQYGLTMPDERPEGRELVQLDPAYAPAPPPAPRPDVERVRHGRMTVAVDPSYSDLGLWEGRTPVTRGRMPEPKPPAPKAAAPAVPTPETARPNAPVPEPAPAPRKNVPVVKGPDTSKYPYGLDLNKLKTMFPEARNAPNLPSTGLQIRDRAPGQSMAPILPRAPQREDNKDLQKQTSRIINALNSVKGGSGGFGDLMRMRLALGFAGQELVPVAAERQRRAAMYDDAMSRYEAEQGLGLKLADLQLGRDRLAQQGDISRAELAQRALEQDRAYGLDRFGTQWDVVKGLMTLEQAERANQLKNRLDPKLYGFDYIDPDTEQVMTGRGVYLGNDPETGQPITRQLSGPQQIVDRFAGVK